MAGPVIEDGRAVIYDRLTGEVIRCHIPTAMENVANGGGRFVHGDSGEPLKAAAAPEPEAEEAPIPLREEDVLDLPAPDAEPELSPAQVEALDRDGDGKAGGSKPRKPTGGFAARASK